MTSWCWICGVNFQTDQPLADMCPECREKESRRFAERMKDVVPFFRSIAEQVNRIVNRPA